MKSFNIITIIIIISCLIGPKAVCSESIYLDQYQTKENQTKLLASTLQKSNSDSIIKIGNFVWRDLNKNGIQDSSDFPLKGVRIDLIKYDDNNVVASTKSDQKGQYEFKPDFSIDPGYYYLKFSFHKEFKPTVMDATDDKYDSDIDKTGKTDTFYLSHNSGNLDFDGGFFYSGSLTGHTIDADSDCTEAKIFEFTELNNLHFDMSPRWQSTPIPGCGSGYAFNNPAWFGFIAADSKLDFLVHVEHCDTEGNNIGLQWGVYDNCEMNNMIAGSCPCVDPKEIFINLNSLTEGETYYLFIDGCNGTFCHFWIEWLTGYCDVEVTGTGFISRNGEDIKYEKFCLGKNYTFNVDSIENADKYTWKIGDEIIETENPKLELKFRKSGYITISVFGSNNCSIGDPYATEVFVFDTIYGDLGKINAIPEQLKAGFLPSGWKGSPIKKYGKDSVLVVNSFGCDQWQFIEVIENLDYSNLMAFYYATNGPGWSNNSGWKEGADSTNCDPCKGWYGVKCQDARVVSIELRQNRLKGVLPQELYNLSELEYLALNGNELFGEVSDSIRKLKKLKFFNLGFNKFSILMSSNIDLSINLKYLYLDNNQIQTVPQEIFKMTSLVDLDISNNFISGELPNSIIMPNLENLNLSNNDFSGKIPHAISDCVKLKSLELNNNHFDGSIPESLTKLKLLWRLNISNNNLSGTIPDNMFTLPELISLYINDNNLEGKILEKIQGLNKLNYLYCHNNKLSGTINIEINNIVGLKYISASNNKFDGQLPANIFNLNLFYLDLSRNNFSGFIPFKKGNSVLLEHLDLSSNMFFGTLSKDIGYFKNLKNLILNNNNLAGAIPLEIGNLNIRILNLKNNNFTDTIPDQICKNKYLKELDLSNNQLTGSIPKSIGKLRFLRNISLNSNHLSGTIPKEIVDLDSLQTINLSNNNLSGCYPEELKQLCDHAILKIFNNNDLLPWKGDFYRFCNSDDQIGASCDDGNDSNGTNDIIDINCNCIGAVKTTDLEVGRIFFNNPVNKVLRINSEIDINYIQIFDINGILLKGYEDINNSFMEIDLSDVAEGIYIMKIGNSKKMNIFKLLKI